jgi:hypothetical protein
MLDLLWSILRDGTASHPRRATICRRAAEARPVRSGREFAARRSLARRFGVASPSRACRRQGASCRPMGASQAQQAEKPRDAVNFVNFGILAGTGDVRFGAGMTVRRAKIAKGLRQPAASSNKGDRR